MKGQGKRPGVTRLVAIGISGNGTQAPTAGHQTNKKKEMRRRPRESGEGIPHGRQHKKKKKPDQNFAQAGLQDDFKHLYSPAKP